MTEFGLQILAVILGMGIFAGIWNAAGKILEHHRRRNHVAYRRWP